jgi:D-alanine-D-alanine ligase
MLYNIDEIPSMLSPSKKLERQAFSWRTIAFVADIFDETASPGPAERRTDLEKTDPEVLNDVVSAVTDLGLDCRHFETPAALAAAAGELGNALVLSTYAGGRSRSRLSLVPAIAESLGLDFVGPDAMGHALAHDKEVMKRIASDCGLTTPRWRVVRDKDAARACKEFPPPYIVKPLSEGSSIGISQANIIRNTDTGIALATELLERFRQPVMVEAFVGGREVSMVSIETMPVAHQAFVEVAVEGAPDYFSDHVFDADEKMNRRLQRHIRRIDGALHPDDDRAIQRLLATIGHYGIVRVDGKLDTDGRFHFLELTTDPWLGRLGHVAQAFMLDGWSYPDVLYAILASARLAPRNRVANG